MWFANGGLYCTKIFKIRKRKKCSLHYRKLKTGSFYRHGGKRLVRIKESPESATIEEFELVAGERVDVPIGLVHQMEALEDAELFEFLIQHVDRDSHRLVSGD